jgi:hypothetical protein
MMDFMKKQGWTILIILLSIIFAVSGFIFLHEYYSKEISDFSVEIMAAVIGTIFTVSAMAILMRMEAAQEKEKEFSKDIFSKKIQLYENLITAIFKMDDNNVIEQEEVTDIENKIGICCLVAGENLVSVLSQFLIQLKLFGRISKEIMREDNFAEQFVAHFQKNPDHLADTKKMFLDKNSKIKKELLLENFEDFFISLDGLVQAVRDDLIQVEGEVKERVGYFVNTKLISVNLPGRV